MAVEEVTCPLPVGKLLARGPGETSGAYPLMVYTLSGTQLKDTEESPLPVKRCWVGGWLKDARRIAHPVERYSVGGLDWEKKNQGIPRAQLKDAEVAPL